MQGAGLPLNNPAQPATSLRPRLSVLSAGSVSIPFPIEASITSNNHFQSDRFSISFAINASASGELGSPSWWAKQTKIPIDIQIGFLPPGVREGIEETTWTSMQQGEADSVDIDISRGLVTIAGRDYTHKFIDAKTQLAYVNQTSSEVVTALAKQAGLSVQATATNTPVGRFWATEHDGVSLDQFHNVTTQWDLITTLARFEGFDAYVQGTTLYFNPITPPNSDPYVVNYSMDEYGRQSGSIFGLKMSRSLTVAKGIQVLVKSWNAKHARAFTRGAPSSTPSSNPDVQQYVFIRPNMTEEQAQQFANARYAEYVRNELTISGTLPGDLILTPRSIVSLQGTGTIYDQVYYPATITRKVSPQSGFTMSISCKNHSTQSEASV